MPNYGNEWDKFSFKFDIVTNETPYILKRNYSVKSQKYKLEIFGTTTKYLYANLVIWSYIYYKRVLTYKLNIVALINEQLYP